MPHNYPIEDEANERSKAFYIETYSCSDEIIRVNKYLRSENISSHVLFHDREKSIDRRHVFNETKIGST